MRSLPPTAWSYPTEIVELTELGRRLETELGTRRYAYALTAPSFDILTVLR